MITLNGLELPTEMVWTDEIWTPVVGSIEYALSGSLILQQGTKLSGRPMTLSREQGEVWARRELVLQLQALAAQAGLEMPLILADGRSFTVVFAPDNPVEARQVLEYNTPQNTTWYLLTLRLLIIKEN